MGVSGSVTASNLADPRRDCTPHRDGQGGLRQFVTARTHAGNGASPCHAARRFSPSCSSRAATTARSGHHRSSRGSARRRGCVRSRSRSCDVNLDRQVAAIAQVPRRVARSGSAARRAPRSEVVLAELGIAQLRALASTSASARAARGARGVVLAGARRGPRRASGGGARCRRCGVVLRRELHRLVDSRRAPRRGGRAATSASAWNVRP